MSNPPRPLSLPSQGTQKSSPGSFPLTHSITLFAFDWFLREGRESRVEGGGEELRTDSSLGSMRPLVDLRGKD